MISTMNYVAGSADPLSPQSCIRKVPVFDGRLRYDLTTEFKRIETVKASKGYQGPVIRLRGLFHARIRLSSEFHHHQVFGVHPRRRGVDGPDRRYARAGAISLFAADAGRDRRAAGDAIPHGRQTPTSRGEYEGAMKAGAANGGRDVLLSSGGPGVIAAQGCRGRLVLRNRFPAIHRMAALNSPKVLRCADALRFWTNSR